VTQGLTAYDRVQRELQLDVPEDFNFAVDVVGSWAQDPSHRAMMWTDERGEERDLSFEHFASRSSRLASGLQRAGVKRGDRVLVIIPPRPEWWETFMALLKLGAVVVPGTSQLTARDISYRVDLAEVRAIIVDETIVDRAEEALGGREAVRVVVGGRDGWVSYDEVVSEGSAAFEPVRTRSDEPAILYFTSGTTGYPKMVLHTHASYGIGHFITGKFWLALGPNDLHWNFSDTGWAKAAWSSLFGPWSVGAGVFVHRQYGKPDPAGLLSQFGRYPITSFCGAPTVYRLLVQQPLRDYTYPALQSCVAAGEPLNPEVIGAWREATGITIRDGYGQTETVVVCANFPGMEIRPGSMGKPSPGFTLDVVGDDARPLPPGREGDIGIRVHPRRPVGLFKEYWHAPLETARAFRGDYYITGDRAYRDEDGYFWFVGRADDVILSAAYRIGPFEVESALIEHPAVAEAAVVGKPDPERGQIVKAFVTLAPGYVGGPELTQELQDHVKRVTAPYKYPREIEYVDDLPKTVSGKIRRVELREMEQTRAGSTPDRPPTEE